MADSDMMDMVSRRFKSMKKSREDLSSYQKGMKKIKERKDKESKKDSVSSEISTKPKIDKATGKGVSKEDCLALGKQALSSFSGDELEEYVRQVFDKAGTYQDVTGVAAIKKAMAEINNEKMAALFHECTKMANNVAKFDNLAKLVKTGKSDVRNILVPRGKRQGESLDGAQKSGRGMLYDSFFDNSWNAEKEKYLLSTADNMSIYDALDGKDAPVLAKEISDHIERYRDIRNAESVKSDAVDIEHLSQWKYLDHNHDATKMMNGGENIVQRAKNLASNTLRKNRNIKPVEIQAKQSWVNYIKPRLDLKAMFKATKGIGLDGELDHEFIDKTLGNTYENITTGRNEKFTRSLVANDRDAIKKKMRMFLYFKDWRSWGEYNEKYGQGSLVDALMADIQKSGGSIGTSNFMGTNPHGVFMDLNRLQDKVAVDIPWEEKLFSKGRRTLETNNEHIFNYMVGSTPTSVRPTLTNFLANTRSFVTAVKAPYITITSISDQAHMLSYLGHYGVNKAKASATLMGTLFNNKMADVALPERKIFAKQMAYLLRSHVGFAARALDSQSVGSWMNHITEGMFKAAGTKAMDEGHLTSALWLISDNIARHSHLSWESIPDGMRTQFEDFSISKGEWDLLRGKTKKKLFSLDNVNSLTDKELRDYYETTDKSIPLNQLRNDLYRKVYSLFDVAAQNTILNPTTFSRANIYGGQIPGEYKTEIFKQVMHMKSFVSQYMDMVWRNGLNRNKGIPAKLMFATSLLAMTTPLAALSNWFLNFSQGKSTDLEDPKFWADCALSGMGMFMNILDPKKQNGDLMFGMAQSPSIKLVQNMMQAPLSLLTGDTEAAAKHFKKAAKYLLPYEQIPFIAPWVRDMLGEESYLQPGQRQIYGA